MSPISDFNTVEEIELFAPVSFPSEDELKIGLVRSDVVYRLEEYRADERKWESITSAAIGAMLGVVVNWATAEPIIISKISVVLLVILVLVTILTGTTAYDFKKRADQLIRNDLQAETTRTTERARLSDVTEVVVTESRIGKISQPRKRK